MELHLFDELILEQQLVASGKKMHWTRMPPTEKNITQTPNQSFSISTQLSYLSLSNKNKKGMKMTSTFVEN
jgi:hypothetical protein